MMNLWPPRSDSAARSSSSSTTCASSRRCDRAVVLHFGQKIYDGTPDGLTQDRGVVDAYLGVAELG